jgi:hypothetical protein
MFCFNTCNLHLLVYMGTVQHISGLHSVAIDADIGRLVVYARGKIPELKNVKSLLWADADADNVVFLFFGDDVENGGGRIALEAFIGLRLRNLDTVAATMNVGSVLPKRKERILHQEEHAGEESVAVDLVQRSPHALKVRECANTLIGVGSPLGVFWIMEIECPRARREWLRGSYR